MTIDLLHWSAYLPYKLQLKLSRGVVFNPKKNEKPLLQKSDATLTPALLDDIQKGVFDSLSSFKPILKDFSWLTKPDENDGVIPILHLVHECVFKYEEEKFPDNWDINFHHYNPKTEICGVYFKLKETGRVMLSFLFVPKLMSISIVDHREGTEKPLHVANQYEAFQYMLSKHIDLFGLIGQKLAIAYEDLI